MGDRRADERTRFCNGLLPPAARVLPGRDVIVVDLSRNGALVEGLWRLRPGSRVGLQLGLASEARVVSGRVERCYVATLGPATVRYRAAIRFDQPMLAEAPASLLEGYPVPEARRHIPGAVGQPLPAGPAIRGKPPRGSPER